MGESGPIKNRAQLLRSEETDLEARHLILGAIEAALSSIDPQNLIKGHVKRDGDRIQIDHLSIDLKEVDKIYVIGGGKASAPMAEALYSILGDRIHYGIVAIPKYQHRRFYTGSIELLKAGHPIPTIESLSAASKILELTDDLNEDDLVFCLISGGGSALMTSPIEGVTLEDKQSITKSLIQSGATIDELNIVRKHLSNIKGGRLAQKIYPARVISLIISDVVGNRIETIASGPTAPDPSTYKDAVEILKKYDIWSKAPESVRKVLEKGVDGLIPETPKSGDKIFERVHNFIIGSNDLACESALKYLESNGLDACILTTLLEGEAREVGKVVSAIARYMKVKKLGARGISIVLGGETTVTVKGSGKGGRNQELVLSACRYIDNVRGLAIASVGTDGIDGFTDAAGGIVDSYTLSRAKRMGLNVESFLQNNDSNTFLERLGDTIITGPTGTNVNDIIIAVRIFE
ncbi:MAG: glycerate kinase [Nitrososphaerota archaeon]|nr:glycerate kinase [Nitrososphaerales archaeon]MDW8044229.1 glycerate kinase [Nitrososphaerota archaeon]